MANMTENEYNTYLDEKRQVTGLAKVAEAMDKLREVGSLLDEAAMLLPAHLEWFRTTDNTLETVWRDHKTVFRDEMRSFVNKHDTINTLNELLDGLNGVSIL